VRIEASLYTLFLTLLLTLSNLHSTAAVTTPTAVNSPYSSWKTITAAAQFPAREGHCSVQLGNALIVTGGRSLQSNLNDVWRSTTGGAQWQQLPNAPWTARGGHSCTVVNGMLIVAAGATTGTTLQDVWATTDGINWTQQTAKAPWSARQFSNLLTVGTNLVLFGGENGAKYLRDVWISRNNGISWSSQTLSAPWSARSRSASVTVQGNTIYMFGGERQGFGSLNDAWASVDMGVTWLRTASSANWKARRGHTVVVASGNMLVLAGGQIANGLFQSDVWQSADYGQTWLLSTSGVFTPRAFTSTVNYNGCVLLIGGLSATCVNNDIYIAGTTCTGNGTKVIGDPEFRGFLGQQFQVHGVPDWIYNIITYDTMQLNTRFKFFGTGRSTLKQLDHIPELHTKSWTHPGNYMGEMGIKLHGDHLYVRPGSWEHGFRGVTLNGMKLHINENKHLPVGEQHIPQSMTSNSDNYQQYIIYKSTHEIQIVTPTVEITLVNADHFINVQEVAIRDLQHASIQYLHGLLGHTADSEVNRRMKKEKKKYPLGHLDDYALVDSDDLFSDNFVNNRYSWGDAQSTIEGGSDEIAIESVGHKEHIKAHQH